MNHSRIVVTILSSGLALLGACSGDEPGATAATESTSEGSSSTTSEDATSATASGGETTSGASDGETSSGTTGEPTTGEPTTSTTGEPTTGEPTTGTTGTTGEPTTTGDTDTDGTTTGGDSGGAAECFEGKFSDEVPPPDYDQFAPVMGSHCKGTNHQEITDIERVVFLVLGDSTDVPLADARPLDDPVRCGLDHLFEIGVGQYLFRQVAAGSDDSGVVQSACLAA